MEHGCVYAAALSALERDGCLRRESLLSGSTQPLLPQLAVYVLSVPSLTRRMRRMRDRLRAAHASDVTWVLCANRDDVKEFTPTTRACLHPEYIPHPWARKGDPARPKSFAMANGTLSLALKHQLAAWDVVRRRLPSAIVLEDDATVPPDLWRRLADFVSIPKDADIFYLGSYSSRPSVGTLNSEPVVVDGGGRAIGIGGGSGRGRAVGGSSSSSTAAPTTASAPAVTLTPPASRVAIHVRQNGSHPLLIGTNAYIVFAKAASALIKPVRAEADIWLSLLDTPTQCRTQRGTAGRATHPELCDRLSAPPANQYGPGSWLVGQDLQGLEQKTHWDTYTSTTASSSAGRPARRQHGRAGSTVRLKML